MSGAPWDLSNVARFNPNTAEPWIRDFDGGDASMVGINDLSVHNYGSSFGTDAEYMAPPAIYPAPAIQPVHSVSVTH